MILINDGTSNINLKVGQKVYYQAEEHGSVGSRVKMTVENEAVLKIIKIQEDHDNPDWEKMAGGDRATKTFVLEALQEGNTILHIRNMYRGDLQKELKVECTIAKE